jgi:phospholipid transport system substrate-binding protein
MSPLPALAPLASWRLAGRCLSALLVLFTLGLGSVGIVGGAQPGDDTGATAGSLRPLDLVKVSVSRVLAIAQSPTVGMTDSEDRRTQIRRIAHDLFAFNEMARRVMGQHSKNCLPQEQDEFVRLFADVFTEAYATVVGRYSGERVAFLSEEVTGSFAQVRSLVTTTTGSEISIEYQLLERGSRWAVYDIVLDGTSLVSTYRSQFTSSMRTSSFAQLMERMRTERLRQSARVAGGSLRANESEAPRERVEGLLVGATSPARGQQK